MLLRRLASLSLAPLAVLAACADDKDGPPPRDPLEHVAARSTACDAPRGSDLPGQNAPAGCKTDAVCTQGANGRCLQAGLGYAECSYDECASDADCGEGELCDCRGLAGSTRANRCVKAGCRTDADCGGPWCSPSLSPGGCGGTSLAFAGYFCHTGADECIDDADCKGEGAGGASCDYDPGAGHWRCSARDCVSD